MALPKKKKPPIKKNGKHKKAIVRALLDIGKPLYSEKEIKEPYTDLQIAKAIRRHKGLLFSVANRLGITAKHLKELIDGSETLKQTLYEAIQARHDFVESRLLKNIRKDKSSDIQFYLRTQCKDRGYDEKGADQSGENMRPININFVPAQYEKNIMKEIKELDNDDNNEDEEDNE
jgi:hypothetical protein